MFVILNSKCAKQNPTWFSHSHKLCSWGGVDPPNQENFVVYDSTCVISAIKVEVTWCNSESYAVLPSTLQKWNALFPANFWIGPSFTWKGKDKVRESPVNMKSFIQAITTYKNLSVVGRTCWNRQQYDHWLYPQSDHPPFVWWFIMWILIFIK